MATLGIIGGMGTHATVDFYSRLVARTSAQSEQDHIQVMIDNDPTIPDRNFSITREGPSSLPKIVASAKRLEAAGVCEVVMVEAIYRDGKREAVGIPTTLDLEGA